MIAECDEPETEERAPIDAYAIALDETWGWILDKADAPFIKAIRSVYLFDRNERVHCCEFTPSFYTIHLYHQVECQPGTSDERATAIYDKYESIPGDNFYVHCHEIERMIAETDTPSCCHLGTPRGDGKLIPYDEMTHDEQMESMREGYTEQPPL